MNFLSKVLNMLRKFLLYTALKIMKIKAQWDEKRNIALDIVFFRKVLKFCNHFASFFQSPLNSVTTTNVSLGDVFSYHIKPAHIENNLTILYLHGGGYVLGLKDYSEKIYLHLCQELATLCHAQVYIVDYRVAPEHPSSVILGDAYKAYMALLGQGIDSEKIIIMGDSAGGGLTVALTMKLRNEHLPLPKATIMLSPWTNLAVNGISIHARKEKDPMLTPFQVSQAAKMVLGNEKAEDCALSPLYGNYQGFPPMMIITGGREILYSDSIDMAVKAKQAGVKVHLDIQEQMFHVYPLFSNFIKEGLDAIERIAFFIKQLSH
jgi:monoterpene epsilon-lactone hydrolase